VCEEGGADQRDAEPPVATRDHLWSLQQRESRTPALVLRSTVCGSRTSSFTITISRRRLTSSAE
jgi:hypothetical protein